MFGFLGTHLGQSAFVGVAAVIVLLKFRRYRAVSGAAIGAVSSAATVGIAIVVALFGLVALGYWDPPVSEIVGDALGASRALYDLVGEWLVEQTLGRLEDVAA
ncbi:hypothetical protein PM076_03535 [Halorubrum ezzemoulense]|uniref:Uncharacterized protein n=1 Tax=Halorubrum ezzemoulense TaxID=337243 RepID=A0A256JE29_HALEZ|nr:hypothetical protein [Halorubrum ezzemoulense]MDB2244498.1 hypothetical protein [Halorubrum ezzemoulense]MDB2278745.1 hypothetical protein [Halorubrum ezzemoulense]MDB2285807.1 hypothetical protein [Halorubrum ezzemoulense]MDB2287832.1 hypothetical protein [Halorubrum ezzemoulense]MDB2291957.1 hypothetical protein [Halorubrum ezzemoulense]